MNQSQNRKIPLDFNLQKASEAELKKLLIKARGCLNPNQSYRVLFLEADKPRSAPQSKYYRYLIGQFCKDTGNDPKWFHDEMKKKFGTKIIEISGSIYEAQASTTTMNTKEMTEFIDKVRQFLLEFFNYETPDPKYIPDEIYAEITKRY